MASEADKDFIALTLLAEARGGGMAGMSAVAFTIRNRADSGLYDSDPYNVVVDPSQFDGATDTNIERARKAAAADPQLYQTARVIVDQIIYADDPPPDITGGALFFHATGSTTTWSSAVTTDFGVQNIGGNTFYSRQTPGNMAQTAVVITRAVKGEPPPNFGTETASEAATRVGTSPSVPGGVVNPPSTRMAYADPVIIDVTGGGVLANGYVVKSTPFTTKRTAPIIGIVMHHTAGSTMSSALNTAGKTGAQYYIDRDGSVVQYAADDVRVTGIRERGDPFRTDNGSYTELLSNNGVINIEIVGAGTGQDDITPEQIEAATALAVKLAEKYNIDPAKIVGHGEIQGGMGGNKLSWEGVRAAAAARMFLNTGGYVPNFVRPEGPAAGMPGAASSRLSTDQPTLTEPPGASIDRMKNDVIVSQGVISRKRIAEADVFSRALIATNGIESATTPILIADEYGNQVDIIDRRPGMDATYDPVRGAFVTIDDFKPGRNIPTGPVDLSAIDLALAMNRPTVADIYDGMYDGGQIDTGGRVVLTPSIVNAVRPEGPAGGMPAAWQTTVAVRPEGPAAGMPAGQAAGTVVAGRPDAPVGSMPAAKRPPVSPVVASPPIRPVGALPAAPLQTMVTGRPDAPIGSLPAAPAPPPIPRPRPAQSSDIPDIKDERRVTANGQEVDLGMIYEVGGQLFVAEGGAGNSAILRKLPQEQQLLLKEVGSRTIAGGIIRDTAGRLIADTIGKAAPAVEATIRGFDLLVGSGEPASVVYIPKVPNAGEEIEKILDSYKADGAIAAARTAVERSRSNPVTRPLVTMPIAPPTRTPSTLPIAPPSKSSSSSSSSSTTIPRGTTLVVSPPPRPVGSLPAARPQTTTQTTTISRPTQTTVPVMRNAISAVPQSKPVTKEITITKQVPVVSYVRPEGPAAGMPAAKVKPLPPPTQTIDPAMRNAISAVQPGLLAPPAPVPMPKPKPVKVVTYKTVTVKKKITVAAPTTAGGGTRTNPVTMPIAPPRPTVYTSGGYTYEKNASGGYTRTGVDPKYAGMSPSERYNALNSGPGSVAAMELAHSGQSRNPQSGGPAAGGEYGGGGR